jgi:hypothetical protein
LVVLVAVGGDVLQLLPQPGNVDVGSSELRQAVGSGFSAHPGAPSVSARSAAFGPATGGRPVRARWSVLRRIAARSCGDSDHVGAQSFVVGKLLHHGGIGRWGCAAKTGLSGAIRTHGFTRLKSG